MPSTSVFTMDDTKLRQLERHYKLRVKTGCETCRTRRVKCDETKPQCMRCTKSGRKCAGYKHASKSPGQSPSAAASFRNPSFLVVPQKPSRNPTRSLSPEAAENRSFFYFQANTLPQWTEFFDSDIWSQKVLQLSHIEPAIKHGILALSTLHERFENTAPIFKSGSDDFAFVQYMHAVKHSNDLLKAHRQGKVDVEKVLIACIIFTCYENLAGNYRAANMHLRNGLRILRQHRQDLLLHTQCTPAQESIANVLYRFDLQAMTFSDNASPYEYNLDCPPECPIIPPIYTSTSDARNDLVGLLRCMMWISGVANINPSAADHPVWLQIYTQLMGSFQAWEEVFNDYEQNICFFDHGDPRMHAGNTLLRIYSLMARTIVGAGTLGKTEMSWDPFIDSFRAIVDLAGTLPTLIRHQTTPPPSHASSRTSSSSPPDTGLYVTPSPCPSPYLRCHPIVTTDSSPTPNFLEPPPIAIGSTSSTTASPSHTPKPASPKQNPASFTPSFELSPIVPLFVTACRCRDPIIRRRAIALLLNSRRREGVFDSYGAGMVALQVVKVEEGLDETVELEPGNWLPLKRQYYDYEGGDVEETARVQDVFVKVDMAERRIGVDFLMGSGGRMDREVKF